MKRTKEAIAAAAKALVDRENKRKKLVALVRARKAVDELNVALVLLRGSDQQQPVELIKRAIGQAKLALDFLR